MELEEVKTIKIRAVSKPGFFGITYYPRSVTTIGCQLSKNGYKTGLTKDDEKFYEEKLNLKPGQLSRHSPWWGEVFNSEYPIRLNNTKVTEFILDGWIEKLKYKVMLEHDKIANSESDKSLPGKLFFIDDPEAKAKKEIITANFKFEGMKHIMNLDLEEKRGALRLLNKNKVGDFGIDDLTESMASSQLFLELEKDPKSFMEIMSDKDIKMKSWIYDLIDKGILKKSGHYIINNDETIAGDIDEAVSYFNDPKNQTIKLALGTKLNKIKKVKTKDN